MMGLKVWDCGKAGRSPQNTTTEVAAVIDGHPEKFDRGATRGLPSALICGMGEAQLLRAAPAPGKGSGRHDEDAVVAVIGGLHADDGQAGGLVRSWKASSPISACSDGGNQTAIRVAGIPCVKGSLCGRCIL